MRFPIGAMSVGDVLDRGLKLLFGRLGTFYLIYLITLSPALVLQLTLPMFLVARGSPVAEAIEGAEVAALLLMIVLTPLGTGATIHIISQEFAGQPSRLGSAFVFALRRFGIVFATSFLCGFLIGLGLIACVVPGVRFLLWWVFAAYGQIPVVEGKGGVEAMSRSKQLTEGFRGRVFGILFLVGATMVILQFGVAFGFEAVLPSTQEVPGELGIPVVVFASWTNHVIKLVAGFLVAALTDTYLSICTTLLYFDLRIRKEGYDLELAARQQVEQTKPAL